MIPESSSDNKSLSSSKVKLESNDSLRYSMAKSQVKLEDSDVQIDDIFALEMSKSHASKYETKKEEDGLMKQETINSNRQVSRIITYQSNKLKKRVIVNSRYENPPLQASHRQALQFTASKIWHSQTLIKQSLRGGENQDNPMTVQHLVPLPPDKKTLQKPKQYIPAGQPVKRKQYRAVVPKHFVSGYDILQSRRQEKKPIDLAVHSLDQVIEFCGIDKDPEGKITRQLPIDITTQFLNNSGTKQIITDFIKLWKEEQIHKYDFGKHPFTLVDHRRISQFLLHLYPDNFTIGSADGFHVNQKKFFERIYMLNAEEYVRLYQNLDLVSRCTWWNNLKLRFKGTQHQHYFTVKEALRDPVAPLSGDQDKLSRVRLMVQIVGNLKLQDPDQQLQKILTNRLDKKPVYSGREQSMRGMNETVNQESNLTSGNTSKATRQDYDSNYDGLNEQQQDQYIGREEDNYDD